jgi:hypothetical protein
MSVLLVITTPPHGLRGMRNSSPAHVPTRRAQRVGPLLLSDASNGADAAGRSSLVRSF